MVTNDLKKGDMVSLRNGWMARIEDNTKGNTRLCTVFGLCTEMGSVYSHDIIAKMEGDKTIKIEHTKKQLALRNVVNKLL